MMEGTHETAAIGAPAMTEEELFTQALEKTDPAQRAAFLDEACGSDRTLRQGVEELIRAHEQSSSFLEPAVEIAPAAAKSDHPAAGATRSMAQEQRPILEKPGTRIGPYRLLQEIAQGGMGAVFMAEQEQPIRRRVALKIIKPGMDTEQVIARFEAERQALALMDHPNIARVLDAGTTESGRPFFVMELVKGVPITDYCDQNRLEPRQRLELFVPVCQAIQHAHQKGIIHRDVKPSNILVTLHDGKPVPKVIDFGIAKAIDQRLTERTLFTQFGAVIGTPEYMSPEQAAMGGLDIDTRSDVYSLGVLLYELLTGSTPLQRQSLRDAAFNEILRRIKEEEPPRPSTRIQTTEELPAIAAQRHVEPAGLAKFVRGELDWIVMKALEKDRTRRYETASGLARDLERYLNGEPVEAGPPGATYKLRKFALKHRAGLVTAAAFAGVLLLATVISILAAVRAIRAEKRSEDSLIKAREEQQKARQSEAETRAVLAFFQEKVLAAGRPEGQDGGLGKDVTIRRAIDAAEPGIAATFKDQPTVEASIRDTLGLTYYYLGENELAIHQLEKGVQLRSVKLGPDHLDTLSGMNDLAVTYGAAGRRADALPLLEKTLNLRRTKLGADHLDTLTSMGNLANAYNEEGRLPEALALRTEELRVRRATQGPDHPDTLLTMNNLAMDYEASGRMADAQPLLEETLKGRRGRLGLEHPYTIGSMDNLANLYHRIGRLNEAIELHTDALKLRRAKLGLDHPDTLLSMNNLAMDYGAAGRNAEALSLLEETLNSRRAKLGPDHPLTLGSLDNLASHYHGIGRLDEAIRLHKLALEMRQAKLGPDHPDTLLSMNNLAEDLRRSGRIPEAIALHERTFAVRASKLGSDHPYTLGSQSNLARAYFDAGSFSKAESVARQCLAIREKVQPENWITFSTRSQLGDTLLAQKRYAEAEPLILQGYEGMKSREAKIPVPQRKRLVEAAERVVKLYEAWGKPEKAADWRKKLGLDATTPSAASRPEKP
jgi:serine/threonine protein kinase/tetratricopeptide (TPR) repeat protein